jgi:UDP-N-acetylmuramyl-tripeptide synthetase
MADRQAAACVMEVSSHALTQDRVRGVEFRVGVFLNLTQDHLDYHTTLQRYAEAKAELFRSMYPGAVACLNADSEASTIMQEALGPGIRVRKFAVHGDAEVRAEDLQCTLEGTRFVLCMPKGRVELMLRLPGAHNVQNALAAASACLALSVSELTIASALEQAQPVAGRLERVGDCEDIRVFVDYGHTPDALEQVCSTLSSLTTGRLLVVFGCGGDRDPTKRPLMTTAVGRYADVAYMTSDNPRSEDPESIINDMEAGIGSDGCAFYRVVDRATAIQRAILLAEPDDTVLIAGKGHESYQILRDSVIPFEDRLAAKEALELRGSPA